MFNSKVLFRDRDNIGSQMKIKGFSLTKFTTPLVLVLLCVNFGLLVWYLFVGYQGWFHSDSAVKVLLAREIVVTGEYFPRDWNYGNNDLFLSNQIFIIPLLAFLPAGFTTHAVSGLISSMLILSGIWFFTGLSKVDISRRLLILAIATSGRNLVSSLKLMHSVSALTRAPNYERDKEVNWLSTDYSSDNLLRLFRGNEALIHLAGQRPYGGNDSNCIENILLDYRVFEAAKKAGLRQLVFASTRGVYGNQPAPWIETTTPNPCSTYALAKLQSEATAHHFSQEGISITTLRLAQVFGRGEYDGSMISTFLRNAFLNRPLVVSAKNVKREYIYVEDVSLAITKVLDNPVAGIFNLGSGEALSIQEIACLILSAFGRNDAPEISKNVQDIFEYSLMSSEKFRSFFSWRPKYSFAEAAVKVAEEVRTKGEVLDNRGLVQS